MRNNQEEPKHSDFRRPHSWLTVTVTFIVTFLILVLNPASGRKIYQRSLSQARQLNKFRKQLLVVAAAVANAAWLTKVNISKLFFSFSDNGNNDNLNVTVDVVMMFEDVGL
ncbi:hypothetical protein EVAR_91208_1 [Eumeta japonica]|uniref:Uncharacterized protein n=1 Tax=Eumeta variegata TaxID=151549 RepID=A0A4C2A601_EUMVA|nr:hypothetical protein EVAR_91208_1 [Eumeta japonica]